MDLKEIMILVKDEDKTEQIKSIDYDGERDKVLITYKTIGQTYGYNCDNVHILEDPERINLDGRVAYISGFPVYDPQEILDFGERIRIIEYNGKSRTIFPQELEIIENDVESREAEGVLNYLKDISQYISGKTEEDTFLKKEMDRLTVVHPESVLSTYLNKKKIKRRHLSMDAVYPFKFNLSQKSALENALSSSVSVIDGPPGTGKTQTILNILANLIMQGKSVAVVSGNNEAVRNVKDKMKNNGYGFLTAMLGNVNNQEHFFNNIPEIDAGGWDCKEENEDLYGQIASLNERLDSLLKINNECAGLKQELLEWQLEHEHFEAYYRKQNIDEVDDFPLFKASADKIMDFLAETFVAKENQQDEKLIYKLRLLFKYRIWDRKNLKSHEASILLMLQKKFYEKQIEDLKDKIEKYDEKLKTLHFDQLADEHQRISEKLFRKSIYQTHGKPKNCRFTKTNFKKQFEDFIKTFPVILSTTHALRRSIPQNYLLDYVIIDEASQVDLITGVLAFSCCRNVVIVGDVKQLPQIVDDKIKKNLISDTADESYDYFKQSILTSIISLYGDTVPREILKEHYRCHPMIIDFCNQKYYDGQLISYKSPGSSEHPLMIYKTAEGNHVRKVTRGSDKGTYNQRELDVIIEEILNGNGSIEDTEHIGIIAPYRKQANKANAMTPNNIESDTVHKYQGREKDIIIMSTVLSETSKAFDLKFVDDPHMINVAVSRAVKQFILVTDHDLFYRKGENIGDLIRYIEYSTLDKNVIESRIVSVFDLLYRRYSDKLNKYKSRINVNARYRSEELIRVLLDEIFEEGFDSFTYIQQMMLKNLLNDTSVLSDREKQFINNRASLDFVIYYKHGKVCAFVIEVDGFAFHENDPEQLERDKLKDEILAKYNIPILRLATNGSGEKEKIRKMLGSIIK